MDHAEATKSIHECDNPTKHALNWTPCIHSSVHGRKRGRSSLKEQRRFIKTEHSDSRIHRDRAVRRAKKDRSMDFEPRRLQKRWREQHTNWRYAYIYAHEYVAYEITNRCGQQECKLHRKSHRDSMKWITTFHEDRTEGAACKGVFHQKKKTWDNHTKRERERALISRVAKTARMITPRDT